MIGALDWKTRMKWLIVTDTIASNLQTLANFLHSVRIGSILQNIFVKITILLKKLECSSPKWYSKLRHDANHNDSQYNDTQYYDTQHNNIQHNDTQLIRLTFNT